MREILFRAQRLDNGEWIYGSFIDQKKYTGLPYMIKMWSMYGDGFYIDHEIDIKTLGQYTGLKDSNGVKIFEGDKVSSQYEQVFHEQEIDEQGTVNFINGSFVINVIINNNNSKEIIPHAWYELSAIMNQSHANIKIIGNIHD